MIVKCAFCNGEITGTDYTTYGQGRKKKKLHKECYDRYLAELEKEKATKSETKEEQEISKKAKAVQKAVNESLGHKEDGNIYKKQLEDYVCQLYGIDSVTPLIQKQIKRYIADYEYTYVGIYQSLFYHFSILKNKINYNFVPNISEATYDYIEAQKFFDLCRNANEDNEQASEENNAVNRIKITPQDRSIPIKFKMEDL